MFHRHSHIRRFLHQGLFNDIDSFSELNHRIKQLSVADGHQAFSVFAQAYLATHTLKYIVDCWPENTLPMKLQTRYGLPGDVAAVDGVFCNLMGEYEAYQVIFADENNPLDPQRSQQFLDKTRYTVRRRLIITNDIKAIPASTLKDPKTYVLAETTFQRLKQPSFQRILSWLQVANAQSGQQLSVDQQQVLKAAFDSFNQQRRVTMKLPPGLDYNQLLWGLFANLGRATNVLVVMPHSYQMQGMLSQWQQLSGDLTLAAMCVDSSACLSKPMDLPLLTDAYALRQYLACQFSGVRVILSNYKTLTMIAAALDGMPPIDLVIYLNVEAIAKSKTPNIQQLLDNQLIRSHGQLLVTPSLQHLDVSTRNKQGEFATQFSFKQESQYGLVNEPTLTTPVTCQLLVSMQASLLLSLEQAFAESPVKRLIVYLPTDEQLVDYIEALSIGFPAYTIFNYYECQDISQQLAYLYQFQASETGLLLAGPELLQVGYDLSVDWVVLAGRNHHFNEITQIIRWLTRSASMPGKLLLPLTVTDEESDLLCIAQVVQVFRELDTQIADLLRTLNHQRGYGKDNDYQPLKAYIDVLTMDNDNIWQENLYAALVDYLGDRWDFQYGALLHYRKQHDHCLVDKALAPELAVWVNQQRKVKQAGTLSQARITMLNVVGFIWDPKAHHWRQMLAQLQAFKQQTGHDHVPKQTDPELAKWMAQQRLAYSKNSLQPEQQQALETLGFIWTAAESEWRAHYQTLCQYQMQHQHCDLNPDFLQQNPSFNRWVKQQRQQRDEMSLEHQQALDEIGFYWHADEPEWRAMFDALQGFSADYGHTDVPAKYEDNPVLGQWVGKQRKAKVLGKLLPEREQKLDQIGFLWDPKETHWQAMYQQLKDYKLTHQHDAVPIDCELGAWVKLQRAAIKRDKMSAEHLQQLQQIEFVSDAGEAVWQANFLQLQLFYQEYNHCHVPLMWEANPDLGKWLAQQRKYYAQDKLTAAQIDNLAELGMIWQPKQDLQDQMFVALAEFHCIHGHCQVPAKCKEYPDLDWWVDVQRTKRKNGLLKPEFIQSLDDFGFIWDVE